MLRGAHWGHRSETGAASGDTNGEEATGEEFFQQNWIPFLLTQCCFCYMWSVGLYYLYYVVTLCWRFHWCGRCTKVFFQRCVMLIPGVFSSPRRQPETLFISTLPDHSQELLDGQRSAKGMVASVLQFLIEFVCLLQLNEDGFSNIWEIWRFEKYFCLKLRQKPQISTIFIHQLEEFQSWFNWLKCVSLNCNYCNLCSDS